MMINKFRRFLLLYFIFFANFSVLADQKTNSKFYLEVGGGPRTSNKAEYSNSNNPIGSGKWVRYNESFEKKVGLGYQINNKNRILIGWRSYKPDIVDNVNGITYDNAWIGVDAYYLNYFRDFPIKNSSFTPYLGYGYGLANVYNPNFGTFTRSNGTSDDSDRGATNHDSSYQHVQIGITYKPQDKYSYFLEASYGGVEDHDIPNKDTGVKQISIRKPKALSYLLGLRVNF